MKGPVLKSSLVVVEDPHLPGGEEGDGCQVLRGSTSVRRGHLATPIHSRAFVLRAGKATEMQLFISGAIDQPVVAAFVSQCPVTYFG